MKVSAMLIMECEVRHRYGNLLPVRQDFGAYQRGGNRTLHLTVRDETLTVLP